MNETESVGTRPPGPAGGGFLAVRSVLVGLTALLGLLLVWRGAVLIGGILLVMAALRVFMLVELRRRRAWRQQRREQFAARVRERRGL